MKERGEVNHPSIEGVDRETALARLAGNAALYGELVELFFQEDHVERLRAALAASNEKKAVFEAHNLKGTAANLGFVRLSGLAAEVERALFLPGGTPAREAFVLLEREYEALCEHMR